MRHLQSQLRQVSKLGVDLETRFARTTFIFSLDRIQNETKVLDPPIQQMIESNADNKTISPSCYETDC
jgi:hypothetical protein